MTNDEIKRRRTRHAEAIRALGEVEDMHLRLELIVTAAPFLIIPRLARLITRLALRIARTTEQDRRADARETYQ